MTTKVIPNPLVVQAVRRAIREAQQQNAIAEMNKAKPKEGV